MEMRKRYYFTLTKGIGKSAVDLFLYQQNGLFKTSHQLHTQYLFNWFQAQWIWFKFNQPRWFKLNGTMFAYEYTSGVVKLRRLDNEMLN